MDTEYFLLCAATNIPDIAYPRGIEPLKKLRDLSDIITAHVDKPNQHYLDFLEYPRRMVSNKIKKILEESNPKTTFKQVVIIDQYQREQLIYWLFTLGEIDFAADTCTCDDRIDFKKLVIDHQKVKKHGYDFFVITRVYEPLLIVNLAIAEKILQTNPFGVEFQRIKAI